MLGYAKDSRLSQIQSVEATYNIESPLKESSYLSLYLTIEPALLVPDAYRENVNHMFFFHSELFIYFCYLSMIRLKAKSCLINLLAG